MSDGQPVKNPASAELVSFVPRLTLEWLRDNPESQWREVEGTLAFVDISGFTAMSERLSSLGRAGAEEVTEVMNATFAASARVVVFIERLLPLNSIRPERGRPIRRIGRIGE